MKKIFVILILFIYSSNIKSQYYENGQDPFYIKWKKIETPHFKIIFSENITSVGKLYAGYLEKMYKTGGITLNHNPRKIPIIIHNNTVLSNGEVAWAPRRMNLYTVPPQSGYFYPYIYNLALHEFRHVVQIDKLNTSNTKILYYIFGEQAVAGVLGWHVPLWFLEGDAVAYETGASNGGRGRIPDFAMKLKAQVNDNKIFSYPKAQFGSYKDFVPNHYELGYQLELIAREKYGSDIWNKTLNKVAKYPIYFNSFSMGIKNVTGLPERKLYEESLNYFAEHNKVDNHKLEKANDYINYYSPYLITDSLIISYKTSYKDIPEIVITDLNKNEKKIIKPGRIFNNTFSYNDSILVWNEFKPTRWENNNYNKIVIYNLKKRRKRYLTHKTRAYYSRISSDNKKILSVEVDKYLKWTITIRDALTGKIIDSLKFTKKQPLQPSWAPDMKSIVFLLLENRGKSLNILDLVTHKIKCISNPDNFYMTNPMYLDNNSIVVKGIYNNKSNYIKYSLNTKQWYVLTDVTYGVGESCAIFKNKFVYPNYTSHGYKLKYENTNNLLDIPINKPEVYNNRHLQQLKKDEKVVDFLNIDTTFNIEKYSRLKHLINIHSWAPLGINLQNKEIGPGVTVMSQNNLSTSIFSGGYLYNKTDETHKYFVKYSYKGFYPIIDNEFSTIYSKDIQYDKNGNIHNISYRDINYQINIKIPFIFNSGKWNRRLVPIISYNYKYITAYEKSNNLLNIGVHNIYNQLYFSNLLNKSYRDLQSRWGQVFKFKYMSSPFNLTQMGQLASSEIWLYTPGILKNQGIKLYGGYQIKEYGKYKYYDQILYPYGYQSIINTQMLSLQAYYTLPLIYPDLNIFEYFYIKRLKSTLFYQFADFKYKNIKQQLISTGLDITADMHIFRLPLPIEVGVRYARLLTKNNNYFQLLINMRF